MSGFICDVCFTLNGERVKLTNISPHLTLLEWLRAQPGLTGTKKMCGEGGCGCCVVSVTRKDPATEKDHTIAINSVRQDSSGVIICSNTTMIPLHSACAPFILCMIGQSRRLKELGG